MKEKTKRKYTPIKGEKGSKEKSKDTSSKKSKYVPSDYDYLKNESNSYDDFGVITREEYEAFKKDPTRIPAMRKKVNDAAWTDIVNQFKNNPDLTGLNMANIKPPYGTGERPLGKYMSTPDKMNSIPPQFENTPPQPMEVNGAKVPAENIVRKSNKVNAYNYKKGRPYNAIEKGIRKFEGGGTWGAVAQAAPYVISAVSSLANKKDVNRLQTNLKPALTKYHRTDYKSNLSEVMDKNSAVYSSIINNNDPGFNTANKNLAYSTLLDSNAKAGMSEAQAKNAFNSNENRVATQVALSNSQSTMSANMASMGMSNDKIIAGTQVRNTGIQDLMNIYSNQQAGNMQSKEMMLKYLENSDNGAVERAASEAGYDNVDDFLNMLNDPNAKFGGNKYKRKKYVGTQGIDPGGEMG